MLSKAVEVKTPVFATVGPVHLRLFPYESDDYDQRPWAWGAMCRITFRIGELTTSKRVSQRVTYLDSLGWARHNRPEEAELVIGRQQVLDNLRTQIARHGFEPPEFEVIEGGGLPAREEGDVK